jgi:glycosyltransferase involved in cell wall biosynthesis
MEPGIQDRKIALVHDWLTGMRGGEKCLEIFCELYPEADLFTLFHETGAVSARLEAMRRRTSFIQRFPEPLRRRYPYYLPLFPFAAHRFDMKGYDVVFSSSHCVAKGVRCGPDTFHVSYIHAPMRYVWDSFDIYFRREHTPPALRLGASMVRPFLQKWDRKSSEGVDVFLCNSRNIQEQIRRHYERNASVIYPPVDLSRFRPASSGKGDYYLMVGALVPNKRVDLAIQAFNRLRLPLKVAGEGWDEKHCRVDAGPCVEFLGRVDDAHLVALYQGARALVFPGVDDFGITPLEAQACGTPVIAYAKGGALETVSDRTGIFFHEPTPEALADAVRRMEERWRRFSRDDLVRNAGRFGRDRFRREIAGALEREYAAWRAARR